MRSIVPILAALALVLSACSPNPLIRDPACSASYDNCVRACEMGPPMPTFGHEGMPAFETGCANGCYTDARACESRAHAREAGEDDEK